MYLPPYSQGQACVLIFPALWGVEGVWIAIVAAEFLAVVTTALFLVGLRKKYNYVLF